MAADISGVWSEEEEEEEEEVVPIHVNTRVPEISTSPIHIPDAIEEAAFIRNLGLIRCIRPDLTDLTDLIL